MKLFVTGACGFIGSHFVEHAIAAGHHIVGLRRGDRAEARPTATLLDGLGVQWVEGDVLQPETLHQALQDVDCVVHFAAAFREGGVDEDYFRRVNVQGTTNLLEAAESRGVKRFVLCSTAGIYGQRVPGLIDETRPVLPWNAYERSKVEAEDEVRRRARASGMEYVILGRRLFTGLATNVCSNCFEVRSVAAFRCSVPAKAVATWCMSRTLRTPSCGPASSRAQQITK